jgi:DNA-binding CsgD family transcriptional regulator
MSGVVIGREREIAEVNGFLTEAAAHACALLLVGDPGIGKTTIWTAANDAATERGFRILVARPSEPEFELAFAVLTDLFAEVEDAPLDGLPEAQRVALEHALRRVEGGSPIDPTAVALATLRVIRHLAAAGPLVVSIDDLQWVDAPSLRALTFAFRRLADDPVGLIATVRTGFEDELASLSSRDEGSIARIDVGGLEQRHLAQLILARTGRTLTRTTLGRLARLSGGSPYYALELAATGDPDVGVPETLAVALRARVQSLSDAARELGLAAAILGRFDESVLGETPRTVIDELRAAGVVDERRGGLGFAHPLLESTLLALHTPQERRAVHLSLAEALDDPDERAVHLGRGTEVPDEAVAQELERAADRLDARGAPETAALLVERAAALTPPESETAKTRRSIKAADLYQAAGEGQIHVLPSLQRLAATLPAGPERARVLVRLGWLGAQLDSLTTSDAVGYQQRALAEANGLPDVSAAAHAVLARLLGIGGDYNAGLRHAELAVAVTSAAGPNLMFPSPSGELGIARFFAGEGFEEHLFEEGIALESAVGRVGEPYQSAKLQLALALLFTGQLTRARALLLEQLELSVELERARSAAGCVLHLVELEVRAGNLAQADAYAAEFVDLDRQLRGDLSAEWYPSGLIAMHAGREEDARRILTAGIDYSRGIESTIWLTHHLWALGHLELSLGNLEEAREALVPLPAMLRDTGLGEWSAHPVHPDAIEALVGLGELEAAAELADELAEYGHRLDRPWGIATAARSRALIAGARAANDEALAAAELALAEHERLDWPFEHARTLLVTGVILRRLGRRRDAAATLEQARALFAALRNPLWLARVDAEARRLGGRRSASGALTPTEERVAELAGQGLRNAEIAAQLFVTPKTVEATLSRVYRKLAVRSRTELARTLAERATDA